MIYKNHLSYQFSKEVIKPDGLIGLEFYTRTGKELNDEMREKKRIRREELKEEKRILKAEKAKKELPTTISYDCDWNNKFRVRGEVKIEVEGDRDELFIEGDYYQVGALSELCASHSEISILRGEICNVNVKEFHLDNLQISKMLFENTELNECWIDGIVFSGCKFKNMTMNIDTFRWVKFKNCSFDNVKFDGKYIRATTFHKGCTFKNFKFDVHQIDEFLYIDGERFSESYDLFKIRK